MAYYVQSIKENRNSLKIRSYEIRPVPISFTYVLALLL
jgi:hypothetical protein